MNMLDSMKEFIQEHHENGDDLYGLCAFLVTPSGDVANYTRLIDKKTMEEGAPAVHQFYGDDMMAAFKKITNE